MEKCLGTSGRLRLAAAAVGAAACVVLAGCGGGASASGRGLPPIPDLPLLVGESAEPASGATVEQIGPASFADRIAATGGVVIGVHVPVEGEIPGTDHHIAWNEISGDARLPSDKATEVLLYCRSGSMSAAAAKTLIEDGYTRVVELEGGYTAWRAEGRPFTAMES